MEWPKRETLFLKLEAGDGKGFLEKSIPSPFLVPFVSQKTSCWKSNKPKNSSRDLTALVWNEIRFNKEPVLASSGLPELHIY